MEQGVDKMEFRRRRLRYSTRCLFAITTLMAMGTYFWLILPTIIAQSFMASVEREYFGTADYLFVDSNDRFLEGMAQKYDRFEVFTRTEQVVTNQAGKKTCLITLKITYGTWNLSSSIRMHIVVTRTGLEKPIPVKEVISGQSIANRSQNGLQP